MTGEGVRICFRPTDRSGWVMTSRTSKSPFAASALRQGTANADVPRKTTDAGFIETIVRYSTAVSHRVPQIAGIIRSLVATIALSIPPTLAGLTSIADVKVSTDLSYADIFVSAVDRTEAAVKFLEAKSSRMRRELALALRVHRVPQFRFHIDIEGQRGERIDRLLELL